MRIDADSRFWVVTDPTRHSDLGDICFETTLDGLRLQFAGGLTMAQNPTVFTDQVEAHDDAKNRLVARRVAERIRIERWLPADEVVKVTLHGEDGTVLFEGEVR